MLEAAVERARENHRRLALVHHRLIVELRHVVHWRRLLAKGRVELVLVRRVEHLVFAEQRVATCVVRGGARVVGRGATEAEAATASAADRDVLAACLMRMVVAVAGDGWGAGRVAGLLGEGEHRVALGQICQAERIIVGAESAKAGQGKGRRQDTKVRVVAKEQVLVGEHEAGGGRVDPAVGRVKNRRGRSVGRFFARRWVGVGGRTECSACFWRRSRRWRSRRPSRRSCF